MPCDSNKHQKQVPKKGGSPNIHTYASMKLSFWIALFVFVNLTTVLFLGGKAEVKSGGLFHRATAFTHNCNLLYLV